MTYQMTMLLAFVAIVIIIVLALYAVQLRRQVTQREQKRLQDLKDVEQKAREKTLENVHIIAQALLDGQVDVMEASIRIRTLVDIIEPEWFLREPVRAFAEITERGAHLDTHKARKALPKQERMKQDVERLALEAEYQDATLEAAHWLLQQKP